jgi:hypothetical protein
MSLNLILVNILVVFLAILGSFYLIRITLKTSGNLRTAMWFITSGIILIVIEHFIIAWLRRSPISLESHLWLLPLPFYIFAIGSILIGSFKLNNIFSKLSLKNTISSRKG